MECHFLQTHLIKVYVIQYVFSNVSCRKIMMIKCRKLSPHITHCCCILLFTGLLNERYFYVQWVTVFKLTALPYYSKKTTGRETYQPASHWKVGLCCHSKGRTVEPACPTGLKKNAISHFLGLHCCSTSLMQDTHRLLHMKFCTVS